MTSASWTTALSESTEEVLEKMFFTCPFEDDGSGDNDSASGFAARVAFRGSPSGALAVNLSTTAARSLASNFFGLEPEELTDKQVTEVVGELANMLCGSLLSHPECEGRFELSSPELAPAEAAKPAPLVCTYNLGDGILKIGLELDEPAH